MIPHKIFHNLFCKLFNGYMIWDGCPYSGLKWEWEYDNNYKKTKRVLRSFTNELTRHEDVTVDSLKCSFCNLIIWKTSGKCKKYSKIPVEFKISEIQYASK
jgi:hypothetical protein